MESGADLFKYRARGRNKPGDPENAIGAAGSNGRGTGNGRRHYAAAAAAVYCGGNPESFGTSWHLSAAGIAARPVYAATAHGLPESRGRAPNSPRPRKRKSTGICKA